MPPESGDAAGSAGSVIRCNTPGALLQAEDSGTLREGAGEGGGSKADQSNSD